MKKNTKKTVKPTYVVDLTDIEGPEDVTIEFIAAKVRAGISITDKEFMYTLGYGAITAFEAVENFYFNHTTCIEDDKLAEKLLKEIKKSITKKTPWYKRFWNWITRKK